MKNPETIVWVALYVTTIVTAFSIVYLINLTGAQSEYIKALTTSNDTLRTQLGIRQELSNNDFEQLREYNRIMNDLFFAKCKSDNSPLNAGELLIKASECAKK